MEDELSLRWRSHLQSQSGVVSREQARAAGFTEKAIAWRLRSGKWQRIHRGVYATFTGKPSREGRLWAAVLCVGHDAVLSHQTAAEVHGLTDKPSTRIHISVSVERYPGRDRNIRGVVIHRSRCLAPEWQPPWQLPRTTVENTVLDTGRRASRRRQVETHPSSAVMAPERGPLMLRRTAAMRLPAWWARRYEHVRGTQGPGGRLSRSGLSRSAEG